MYSVRLLQLFADYEITGYCEASLKMACLFMWVSSDWYSAEDGVTSAAEKTKTLNERKTNFNRVYLGKRLLLNVETGHSALKFTSTLQFSLFSRSTKVTFFMFLLDWSSP